MKVYFLFFQLLFLIKYFLENYISNLFSFYITFCRLLRLQIPLLYFVIIVACFNSKQWNDKIYLAVNFSILLF